MKNNLFKNITLALMLFLSSFKYAQADNGAISNFKVTKSDDNKVVKKGLISTVSVDVKEGEDAENLYYSYTCTHPSGKSEVFKGTYEHGDDEESHTHLYSPEYDFSEVGDYKITVLVTCGKDEEEETTCTVNTCTYTVHVPAPLPLTLISFTGQNKPEGQSFAWVTASEVNIKVITLEGSMDALTFKPVTDILPHGAGNYSALVKTSYTYFRLKIIDKDASFTYSPIIFLSQSLSSVYTVNGIDFELGAGDSVSQVYAYDIMGRVVDIENPGEGLRIITLLTSSGKKLTKKVYYGQ
jgi:hypothetical protein